MKAITVVVMLISLIGCASTNGKPNPNWEWLMDPPCPGTRYYDPQVCKGQSFGAPLPNQQFEALARYNRGERW